MATVISKLSAIVGLDAKGLTSGLQNAQASVSRFATTTQGRFNSLSTRVTGSISRIGGSLRSLALTIATVAGAWKLWDASTKQSSYIDATAKAADAIGIQIQKLIGLHSAAELAGVENEELNRFIPRIP